MLDPLIDLLALRALLEPLDLVVEAKQSTVGLKEDVVALLVGPETPLSPVEVLALGGLRLVVATSVGRDHLPLDALVAQGVEIADCAGYCSEEVAEHTVALVLDLLRATTRLDRDVHAGRWTHDRVPRRVSGTAVGVIGLGRIGRLVAEKVAALGMRVSAHDPFLAGPPPPEITIAESLDDLLSGSELVTLHVPLTARTRRLIGARELALLPAKALIVNVARGELLDEEAVLEALSSGQLAGAALDTLATEPPRADHPLLSARGVVVTPHSAWYSPEATGRLTALAGAAVLSALGRR